jgi:hypothetical protein
VRFSGTAMSSGGVNILPIKQDVASGNYPSNHFTIDNSSGCSVDDEGTIINQYPVAYVSGTKARAKATFETNCQNPLYIRGIGPSATGGQIQFPSKSITPSNGTIIYNYEDATTPFDNEKVKYWEEFKILWQFSEDQTEWEDIGESNNPMYVTYKKPEPAEPLVTDPTTGLVSGGYEHFHTLFKLSCEAADGMTTDEDIIDAIWNKISTLNVDKADGSDLFYYQNWGTCFSTTTTELISNGDGQCGSWTKFFIDLLKIHSIEHSTVDDEFYAFSPVVEDASIPAELLPTGFFVNNWQITGSQIMDDYGAYTSLAYPKYSSTNPEWWTDIFLADNQHNFHYTQLEPLSGIDGQGPNDNPQSIFENHQITQINGVLMDPSYGEVFENIEELESEAISGYYQLLIFPGFDETQFDPDGDGIPNPTDLNGDGDKNDTDVSTYIILYSPNLNNYDLERIPSIITNY